MRIELDKSKLECLLQRENPVLCETLWKEHIHVKMLLASRTGEEMQKTALEAGIVVHVFSAEVVFWCMNNENLRALEKYFPMHVFHFPEV